MGWPLDVVNVFNHYILQGPTSSFGFEAASLVFQSLLEVYMQNIPGVASIFMLLKSRKRRAPMRHLPTYW